MSSIKSFQEKSYCQHSEHFKQYSADGKKKIQAKQWLKNNTVDAWRHQRMYHALDPVLISDPNGNWLTVGDGRYATDAKYILEKGCTVLSTDISDILLKEAKEIGYIHAYKKENAESLSFQDNEFDYVFCKESYHHFPRPALALYEMLRVAKKGVLLIEPNDRYINNKIPEILFKIFKNIIKLSLNKKTRRHSFEKSGNYVFSISRREIEKVALGLNYKIVAFKGINDAYFEGVEYEYFSENGPLQKKVRLRIKLANFLCKIGFMDFGILTAIIFKKEPSQKMSQQLAKNGYEIILLPDNPYINKYKELCMGDN